MNVLFHHFEKLRNVSQHQPDFVHSVRSDTHSSRCGGS